MAALDKGLRERTQFELVNIQERVGITFIMVTHDQEEAMTMSSRIGVMEEGRIRQIGAPHDVYRFRFTICRGDHWEQLIFLKALLSKMSLTMSYSLILKQRDANFMLPILQLFLWGPSCRCRSRLEKVMIWQEFNLPVIVICQRDGQRDCLSGGYIDLLCRTSVG